MSKLKNILLYCLGCVMLWAACYYGTHYYMDLRSDRVVPPQAYLYHYIHQEPYIEGPPAFQENIKKALATVEKVSPEQYKDIEKYCIRVRLDDRYNKVSAVAYNSTVYVIKNRYNKDKNCVYYLERLVIHEATHLKQYEQNQGSETIEKREAESLASERKLLRNLKIPPADIERVAGDHLLKTRWWEKVNKNVMGRN
ncbi:MAG: hypothetical protein ACM3QW_10130 [Ignavibacteriales bacterium]